MRITLPVPPSANSYWRIFQGRIIKSKAGRDYNKTAAWEAKAQGGDLVDGPVSVFIKIYRPQKRGDIDNYLKVALDSLNGVLWADDSQIVDLHILRFDDKEKPRLEIQVNKLNG